MPDWSYPNQYVPQSQYYEQDWNNHDQSSHSQWGYNSPESYGQLSYQHLASYISSPEQPLEEPIDWEKRMKALEELEGRIQNLEDSKFHQSFQIQDSSPTARRTYRLRKEYGIHDSIPK